VQLLEGKEQLGSTTWSGSGAPPAGVVDVEVPKQYRVRKSIISGSRTKSKNLLGVKRKGLIRGLVFRGGGGETSHSLHIVDHDISYTFNRTPEM
jgi:hypothetical protein